MKTLLEAVGLIILSMGGTGAIIMSVSSFLANKIATRLEQKYKLRIDKELEAYKAGLTQRSYVTKVQFDIEFELYRKLSKGMFEFIRTLYTTIEEKHYPKKEGENHREKVAEEIRTYTKMVDNAATLQELLYENAAYCRINRYVSFLRSHYTHYTGRWGYRGRHFLPPSCTIRHTMRTSLPAAPSQKGTFPRTHDTWSSWSQKRPFGQ